jgi:hypothetical protein
MESHVIDTSWCINCDVPWGDGWAKLLRIVARRNDDRGRFVTAESPSLSVLHREERNVVALFEQRVLMFVRSGPLTEAALRAMSDVGLLLASVASEERSHGFLGVVPSEAGASDARLYDSQLALFRSVGAAQHVYAALCVLGDHGHHSPVTHVARSLSALLPNAMVFDETASATRWLSERLSLDARALGRAALEVGFLAR